MALVGLGVGSRPVFAVDGDVQRITDGTPDGYYYNVGGSGEDRYIVEYLAGTLPDGAVVCGATVREINRGDAPFGVMRGDLRCEDPANPGFPDLGPRGLIALADPSSLGPCSNDGSTPRLFTFGDGSGIPEPGRTHYFSAIQPEMGSGPLDFCGVMLDTSSPSNGRSKYYADGEFGTLQWNHFVEEVVSTPRPVRVQMKATGTRQFPGDRGLPVVVVNRPNGEGLVSDDNLTLTVVVDNALGGPISRRIAVLADRSVLGDRTGTKNIAGAFRVLDSGTALDADWTLPIGRTVIRAHIDREPIKRRMARYVEREGPLNIPLVVALAGGGAGAAGGEKGPGTSPGLRQVGRGDDGTGDAFFVVQVPVQRGDSLNVAAPFERAPKVPFVVSAVQVVLGEFGGRGLPGLDAVEGRFEDQVMSNSPDLSPSGLIFSVGREDGVGEIPGGPAPTTVTLDIPDMLIEPKELSGVVVCDLVVRALLLPGDFANGVGTAVGADTAPGDTILGVSSFTRAGQNPATKDDTANYMIGLVVDGDSRMLTGSTRETGALPPLVTWRAVGTHIAVDRHGNRIL